MNSSTVNGSSLNGSIRSTWVIQAAVSGLVAATVVAAVATKVLIGQASSTSAATSTAAPLLSKYGTSIGDATATASAGQLLTKYGQASNDTIASASLSCTLTQSAFSVGQADGIGYVDDSTKTHNGQANESASAIVNATPTLTQFGRSIGYAGTEIYVSPTLNLDGAATSNSGSIGYALVLRNVYASAGGDATSTGEALTAKALGSSVANATATAIQAAAHIVYPGLAFVVAEASSVPPSGNVARYPTVLAGFGEVNYTRAEGSVKRIGQSYYNHDGFVLLATAGCVGEIPQDRVTTIATIGSFAFGECSSSGSMFSTFSGKASATAESSAVNAIGVKSQTSSSTGVSGASGSITATRTQYGTTLIPFVGPLPPGEVPLDYAPYGEAFSYGPRARVRYAAKAAADVVAYCQQSDGIRAMACAATAQAAASHNSIQYALQHYAAVESSSTTNGVASAWYTGAGAATDVASSNQQEVFATRITFSSVDDALSTATVGRAYGITNVDVKAPADRYMIIQVENRIMIVPAENRTMVTA